MSEKSLSVAVVTGSAQGIGLAIATELSRRGLAVAVADVRLDAAERAAESVRDSGGDAVAFEVDVRSRQSVDAFAGSVLAHWGRLDVLVNNAGISVSGPTAEQSDDDWLRVVDVNLNGVFRCCRAFAAPLHAARGAVVNVSSIAAFAAPRPEIHAGYDATKAAVTAFSRTLAVEWAPDVRVNAIAPGYTETELLKSVGAEDPETLAAWIGSVPQRRLIAPEEIARVVGFLASSDASPITGQTLLADGGWLAAK